MRLWAEIYSQTDVKLGVIPTLLSAEVKRRLDESGTISLTASAADATALELLQSEYKARVFIEQDEQIRFFGAGVMREIEHDDAESGGRINVNGPDSLDALTRKSVLLGRTYDAQSIETIAADLVGLVTGWVALVETGLGTQTARFDGISVFKALRNMVDAKGLHLREGDVMNTVEIGAFGDAAGVIAIKPDSLSDELANRDDVLLISHLKRKVNSREVVNWIIPLGAGEGSAAFSLADSSHSVATTIGPDGKTLYYLKDQDSIDAYGQTEEIKTFPQIAPSGNNMTARQRAADALYDAATAWLERAAVPLTTYSMSVKHCRQLIKPGTLIPVHYKGQIETESGALTSVDIDDTFWVMSVSERASESGVMTDLEISTIDRLPKTMVDTIIEAVERSEVNNVGVKRYVTLLQSSGSQFIQADPSGSGGQNYQAAIFRLQIDDRVTDVNKVMLYATSEPLFATALVTTAGAWTPVYNAILLRGPNYPYQCSVFIDNVDVTTDLGGPFGTGTSPFTMNIEITDFIKNAAGGLYQWHTIEFRATVRNTTVNYSGYSAASDPNLASNGRINCTITAEIVSQNFG